MNSEESWEGPDGPERGLHVFEWAWLALYRLVVETVSWVWHHYLTYLLGPTILAFSIPLVLCLLIYITSIMAFAYQHGVFRVLMKAASERDIEQVARTVLATSWVVVGQIWFGYEVRGLENLPPEGTGALLVYYHGALPVDYYFFLAYLIVHRPDRIPHSVADHFMFKIPGLGTILKLLRITPGTVESCTKDLREGNLLGIAPGGVYESQFSDHNYKVLWKSRVGFAKIALKAEAPVVPMFTRNVREAFRTISTFRWAFMEVYHKIKFPCVPMYGGFPVKLVTYVGEPIPHHPKDTPQTLREKCQSAVEGLIALHQPLPGNIFWALLERFYNFRGDIIDRPCEAKSDSANGLRGNAKSEANKEVVRIQDEDPLNHRTSKIKES